MNAFHKTGQQQNVHIFGIIMPPTRQQINRVLLQENSENLGTSQCYVALAKTECRSM